MAKIVQGRGMIRTREGNCSTKKTKKESRTYHASGPPRVLDVLQRRLLRDTFIFFIFLIFLILVVLLVLLALALALALLSLCLSLPIVTRSLLTVSSVIFIITINRPVF